jgi:hypothetical protein
MSNLNSIIKQIKPANLNLLNEEDLNDEYVLTKMLAWQEEYDNSDEIVTWEYFKENYLWCARCKSYNEGQCICYARK